MKKQKISEALSARAARLREISEQLSLLADRIDRSARDCTFSSIERTRNEMSEVAAMIDGLGLEEFARQLNSMVADMHPNTDMLTNSTYNRNYS
ncbi:hypothetical protein [Mesorhizobium cantuariense]|uniref:Uncharacterized protein n=1 Tax=Mesorhizobium cantuariense TaxID=1300275 RepID=A0ABV7MMR8_9HYPH